jgi:recombinational DNA repair protein (RecF pathway)
LGNIASALTEHYFLNVKSNDVALQYVFEAIASFEKLIDFEEKDEALFLLLQSYLIAANILAGDGKEEKVRIVTQGFLFQLLSHLGYHLEMHTCVVSGEVLSATSKYFFSPEAGGVVSAAFVNRSQRVVSLNHNAIKVMRIFSHNKLSSLHRLQVSHEDLVCVEHVSRAFLQWIER